MLVENNISGENKKCKEQMNIRRYFSDNDTNKNNKKKRAEYQGKTASNFHNWGYSVQARRPTAGQFPVPYTVQKSLVVHIVRNGLILANHVLISHSSKNKE